MFRSSFIRHRHKNLSHSLEYFEGPQNSFFYLFSPPILKNLNWVQWPIIPALGGGGRRTRSSKPAWAIRDPSQETEWWGHLFTAVLLTMPRCKTTWVSTSAWTDGESVVSLHSGTSPGSPRHRRTRQEVIPKIQGQPGQHSKTLS